MPLKTLSPKRLTGTALALFAATAFAAPALAGDCPAGKMGTNALANYPTEGKAVTDNVIGLVELEREIGVADRQLRTRMLVVQPGGVVPYHSHADRPALIYTLSGAITEYRSSCMVPIEHHAGDIAREADSIAHYWVNTGTVPAVLLSSDVHHGK